MPWHEAQYLARVKVYNILLTMLYYSFYAKSTTKVQLVGMEEIDVSMVQKKKRPRGKERY